MSDVDIIFSSTPRAMIMRLIPTITDNSFLASYVNSHFGTSVTAKRVAELRKSYPQPHVNNLEPLQSNEQDNWNRQARLSDARMVDRLRSVGR